MLTAKATRHVRMAHVGGGGGGEVLLGDYVRFVWGWDNECICYFSKSMVFKKKSKGNKLSQNR